MKQQGLRFIPVSQSEHAREATHPLLRPLVAGAMGNEKFDQTTCLCEVASPQRDRNIAERQSIDHGVCVTALARGGYRIGCRDHGLVGEALQPQNARQLRRHRNRSLDLIAKPQ
jgi:hypothetical protein